jgi:mRNA interferase MazF
MTSSSKPYPTRVAVRHKTTKGWIAIDQIRTIDRIRIVKYFETLTEKEITKVKNVIQATFVE